MSTSGASGAALQQTSIAAATSAISNTETVVVSAPLVAANTLRVGSRVRITIEGTSTATAANVTTFTIRAGTAGTTSDASVMSFATAASGTTGTAIPFKAVIEFTVRTLGAAGTAAGSMILFANAATAINGAVGPLIVAATSSTLATTTATFLTATLNNAASTTAETVQDATIEILP